MLNLGSIPLARYEHQTPLPILILQTTVILGLGYISLSTIFNLVFHPLANVPGPFWARCSNLWGRYQNLHGQKAHSIHAAHKRYGKLASPRSHGDAKFSRVSCEDCSQYVVLFESFFCAWDLHVQNIRQRGNILCKLISASIPWSATLFRSETHGTSNGRQRKESFMRITYSAFGELTCRCLQPSTCMNAVHLMIITWIRDTAAHHQRRKLLSRGFSQAALAEFEPVIHSKIHTLIQQLSKISSTVSVFDVYPWVHMLSFDIICIYTGLFLP